MVLKITNFDYNIYKNYTLMILEFINAFLSIFIFLLYFAKIVYIFIKFKIRKWIEKFITFENIYLAFHFYVFIKYYLLLI